LNSTRDRRPRECGARLWNRCARPPTLGGKTIERSDDDGKPRESWKIRPSKNPASVPASIKAEVETKAANLIESALTPRHVRPRPKGHQLNPITDIGAKWYRGYFCFLSIYACPGPNAFSATFESKFARLEYLGHGRFVLYFMRHSGKEWLGIFDDLSVDECMKAILEDEWFVP
jgi:hypothetical protein